MQMAHSEITTGLPIPQGTLTVTQATGTITISGNEQTYDGTGQSVTVGTAGVTESRSL